MKVITVSREFASGGRELGEKLAACLGYEYYDKEIISAIANEKGLNENYIASVIENGNFRTYSIPIGRSFSLQPVFFNQQKIEILTAQEKVIKKIADTKNAVIIGRCADAILEDYDSFNIFVYSDMKSKIKRCRKYAPENENLSDEELLKKIKQINKNRKEYYEAYTDKTWGAKENYHLCINTNNIEIEKIIPAIAEYIKAYFKERN